MKLFYLFIPFVFLFSCQEEDEFVNRESIVFSVDSLGRVLFDEEEVTLVLSKNIIRSHMVDNAPNADVVIRSDENAAYTVIFDLISIFKEEKMMFYNKKSMLLFGKKFKHLNLSRKNEIEACFCFEVKLKFS